MSKVYKASTNFRLSYFTIIIKPFPITKMIKESYYYSKVGGRKSEDRIDFNELVVRDSRQGR